MRYLAVILGLGLGLSLSFGGEILKMREGNPGILDRPAYINVMEGKGQRFKIVCVPVGGTRVEVIDRVEKNGMVYYKVRVLEGSCKGKEGYIGPSWLTRN